MRTTVIPAQITTVEDKIAGNFNLTQILILMAPIFWTAIVYTLFVPSLRLVWYKIPLILIFLFACLILSLRIKGKVVLEWVIILLRYNLRPQFYIFNKNDSYLRTLYMPEIEKKKQYRLKTRIRRQMVKEPQINLAVNKLLQFEQAIQEKYVISYKSKKGGINVAFEQIKE
ncbi:MAG TPA: hypothetical protein VK338_04730 [Candidatus Nitrosocosmicus sp.]|nr:hypothetical protein [Candidatus Nitrosocosmicus sp.]